MTKYEWIKVKDKLPDNKRYVLVFCKDSSPSTFISWYSNIYKGWMIKKNNFKEITHWAELLEDPED